MAGVLIGMGVMQLIAACTLSMLLRHTKRVVVIGRYCAGPLRLLTQWTGVRFTFAPCFVHSCWLHVSRLSAAGSAALEAFQG